MFKIMNVMTVWSDEWLTLLHRDRRGRDQGEVYNIMWSSLSVTCNRLVVFSTNKTDSQDRTEILLKVALNTIKQTNNKHTLLYHDESEHVFFFDTSSSLTLKQYDD